MPPNQTPNPQPTNPPQPSPTPPTAPGQVPVASSNPVPAPPMGVPNAPLPGATPPPVAPTNMPSPTPAPALGTPPPSVAPNPNLPVAPIQTPTAPPAPAQPLSATPSPAPLPTPVPAPSAPSFQNVASTPSPATYGMPAPAMATAVPMGASNTFGASGNEAGMVAKGKLNLGLIIGLLVGLVAIVAIGLMAWLNWDHLAIMFDPKFAYYTIDNGDQGKYEVKFYKGATIKKGSDLEFFKSMDGISRFDAVKSANWLYLKPSDSSKAPLVLLIGGEKDISDTCKDPSVSDTITSTVNADKNWVCFQTEHSSIKEDDSTTMVGVALKFNQKNSAFRAIVTNDIDTYAEGMNIAKSAFSGIDSVQKAMDEVYGKYDLASRKDDIKTILASIRVLSEPKK